MAHFGCALTFIAVLAIASAETAAEVQPAIRPARAKLEDFVKGLWPKAREAGVKREVFDKAFKGITVDPSVEALTRKQPEYNLPLGDYLGRAVSASRIAVGQKLLQKWSPVLDRIEEKFGVDRFFIVALWGLESGYGASGGNQDVLRSLTTLAYIGYRDTFFSDELILALGILQTEKIDRSQLVGSWAGAMGQPQFLPSSFHKYAVDFDGDGRRDIWNSVPDVLASIANYLKLSGWDSTKPWGLAVNLPPKYDLRVSRGTFDEWRTRGATGVSGKAIPNSGDAILFHPAGYPGPAFLVTNNFNVIKTYNNSDAYALAIAFLADGLRGAAPQPLSWPNTRPLDRQSRIDLQRAIARLGYPVNDFEGHIDFDLRDIVRRVQSENGMTPDGNPGKELLAVVLRDAAARK
jgi:membrane-bound lytic murein transglycosylase B